MTPRMQRCARRLLARSDVELLDLPAPKPKYDPRLILPGFETPRRARARRKNLLRLLNPEDTAALALQAAVSGCGKGQRCKSAGCDECIRRFRLRWSAAVAAYIDADKRDWFMMTLVPPSLAYPIGMLDQFDPRRWKDSFRKQIERSQLAEVTMIGAFDFAVHSTGRSLVWRPHLCCFFAGQDKRTIRDALVDFYRPTTAVPRPLKIERLDRNSLVRAITYSFKATFKERSPSRDARGHADTKERPLASRHWAELAPLLHSWGFAGRLFRRGLVRNKRLASTTKRVDVDW